jgi:hypothetical protein
VLVVWKLDRLSRSLRDVLTIKESFGEAGAGFRSLTEAIDTTTPAGRMMMQMVGAFAEFERAMLKERTKAGLDAAREQGRIGGRRPRQSTDLAISDRASCSYRIVPHFWQFRLLPPRAAADVCRYPLVARTQIKRKGCRQIHLFHFDQQILGPGCGRVS